ncbi:Nutrient and stress factor 1 [Penicillium ucsense]|uniref:Nutrient and stress factor 1 n=1 Tax=Penicillium ucsense TaxID=2839758 RepID=A0A8J8W9L8_9EURO|nr:Nutrient and stress factor 1 [Penicillium ucsense]KAF7735662.1 Nutrient and stress factor 1 [Penicillium ucsense]
MSGDTPISSIVSILNNDDHPSFAVRSNQNQNQTQTSPSPQSQSQYPQVTSQLPPPFCEPQYARQYTASQSPNTSPRGRQRSSGHPTEAPQVTSPGSSDGSSYGYLSSQGSSKAYHPYARQEAQQGTFTYTSRGPAAPRTPPAVPINQDPETESPRSQSASSRGLGRKSKYPCPYARSHGCIATFTTSGHAARHGKKHTGEKSVHCPICSKAFTRKDNMKQHIRTHRTRSNDKPSASAETDADSRWAETHSDTNEPAVHLSRSTSRSTVASTITPSSITGPQPSLMKDDR